MAEYSKQFIDRFDPGGMDWDFDIEAVAAELLNGESIPMICEGFGFVAIGKFDSGEIVLFYPEASLEETGGWISLQEILEGPLRWE